MRLLHSLSRTHASFDDPNLVSRAGLVPVMALAQRCGLADLAGEHVTIASPCNNRTCEVSSPLGTWKLQQLPSSQFRGHLSH